MSEDNQGPLSTELSTDSMDASDVVQDSAGLRVSTPGILCIGVLEHTCSKNGSFLK